MRASSTERFLASLSRRRNLAEMETQPAPVPVSARETEQDVEEEEESPDRTSETAAQQQLRDKIQATTNRVNAGQVLHGEFADPLEEGEERGEMATLAQRKHEPCTISKDLLQLERASSSLENSLRVFQSKAASSSTWQEETCARAMPPLPESSVLGRVKSFLPVLDEANRNLFSDIQERGAEQFDIEVVNVGDDKPYIQMDLALGFADLYTPEAVAAAELAANGQLQQREIPIGFAENSSESESDSDSDEEQETLENALSTRDFRTSSATVEMTSNDRVSKRSKIQPM
ncbi:hypothetical protein CY35_01G054500 [Sphagnum magellanicum]|nr:hypothetical protein CY35_01G054500 [Sphagnum magellanicum]